MWNVLETDHGEYTENETEIEGGLCETSVCLTCRAVPGLPVFGVAMPSVEGIKKVLQCVNAGPAGNHQVRATQSHGSVSAFLSHQQYQRHLRPSVLVSILCRFPFLCSPHHILQSTW